MSVWHIEPLQQNFGPPLNKDLDTLHESPPNHVCHGSSKIRDKVLLDVVSNMSQ